MQRVMLRAKLHRATVTEADLNYEGSCGIDEDLLDAADMKEFEYIELYNINNGERFSTYIIKAARGSGVISLNGAAARRAHVGDLLIICTYGPVAENEVPTWKPKVVLVDDNNRVKEIREAIANGTFRVNAEAVAGKLLANSEEFLSYSRA